VAAFGLAGAALAGTTFTGGPASATIGVDTGVSAWGQNGFGSLGDGTTESRPTATPFAGPDIPFVGLAMGEHSLGITNRLTVWGWGDNSTRAIIGPSLTAPGTIPTPVEIPGLFGARQVAVTPYSSLVLRNDGKVYFWGLPIGQKEGSGPTAPVPVPGLPDDMIEIAAASTHAFALRRNGELWAWGENPNGVLGVGDTAARLTPVRVPGTYNHVGTGVHHTVASSFAGARVWAWGQNDAGQLGLGPNVPSEVFSPRQVSGGQVPGDRVVKLAGGFEHSLAVLTDGSVWAWGDNTFGQLGTGNQFGSNVPVRTAMPASGAVSVSAGPFYSAAVTRAGEALVWGDNRTEMLGDGTRIPRFVPTPLAGVDHPVTTVATGLSSAGVTFGRLTTVPAAAGQPSLVAANVVLRSADLFFGRLTGRNSTIPAGTVLDQYPFSGTVLPSGSEVDLVISLGPA
jgi:alpha-tubulin suppressor-like RCC1 family protein